MNTSFSRTLSVWVLPGLIAGLAFLFIALLSGATSTSVWAMPNAIAHVLGMAVPADYSFALGPVLVGIVVHLVFSIILGIILVAIVRWRHLRGWLVVGAAFLLITLETPIALWVVMHTLLPAATFSFYLAAVPLWGSVLGHYLYALVLGLLVIRNPFIVAPQSQQSSARLEAAE